MTKFLPDRHSFLRSIRGGLILLLTLVLTAPGASPTRAQTADSTQLKRFQMADSYVRAGKFERAIALLEDLYAESPDNLSFFRKLKEAYESVKRYDDAIQLVEDRIDGSPTPGLLSEKARLLHQQGNRKKASQVWDRALSLAPNRAETYRTVYQTLLDIRRFKKAIDVLTQGREALDRPAAFRTELAYLYGLSGQHEEAMREYVALLANSPQRLAFVRNRLQTFVEQGEGTEASIEVLRTAVEEAPLNSAYRHLLAWLYMEQRDYAAAFDVYRAIDRLEEAQGRVLVRFARKAMDAQKYAVATEAYETVLDRHSGSDVAPRAQQALGDVYRQWAQAAPDSATVAQDSVRYEQARQAYQTFLQTYPGNQRYPQVLLRLGTLELDVYRDLAQAESTLKQLVTDHAGTPAAAEGQYHLARIALFRNDLERARLLFTRLANNAQNSDLANKARFELARLQFYQGDFESALARTKAISQNTATDVANNAIELKVLLQENRGPDSLDTALRTYARARLSDRQHRYETALAALDSLIQNHPRHSLVDDARFRRAQVHLARHDTSAALSAFRALPKQHPRSPFADRSLFRIGTLLEARGQRTAAVDVYNRLLSNYPASLRAGKARSRLRTLLRTQG